MLAQHLRDVCGYETIIKPQNQFCCVEGDDRDTILQHITTTNNTITTTTSLLQLSWPHFTTLYHLPCPTALQLSMKTVTGEPGLNSVRLDGKDT
mgnify:CR=1 FL=1